MKEGAIRRFWVATHRYLGLFALTFLSLAAITGVILCFRDPLDRALNPDLFRPQAGPARIEPLAAAAALARNRPDLKVVEIPLNPRPGDTLRVEVAPSRDDAKLGFDQAYLDNSDGHIRGVRQTRAGWDRRHLVQDIYLFHYTLLAGDPGRWFMGAVALAWLLSNLIGLYLTFPKHGPLVRQWLRAFALRPGRSLARLLLELHRVTGLWLLLGLIVLAYTSVGMNYFAEALTPTVNAASPARPSPFDRGPPAKVPPPAISFAKAVENGGAEAARRFPALTPARVKYDSDYGLFEVMLTRSGVEDYRSLGPVFLHFDGRSGRLAYVDDPYTDSLGRKLSRSLFPLHTGEVAGPLGVGFVFILGLATLEMCVSGLYVWWRRRPGRVAAKGGR
jgi:uncharacterized iron-regulated membrane protein